MTPPDQPTVPPSVSPDVTQQTTTAEAVATDPYIGSGPESAPGSLGGTSSVGRKIGAYEILAELGRGGMGVVYKARQPALNRTVALKMIRSANLAGDEELARFRAEAQSAARLQHPNIVTLYEIGEQEQMPFFSLEYVEGINLAQYLASNPQPASEAAALVEVLARAMHYAHSRNIIHRDLKPANVLLQGVESQDRKGTARRETTRDSRPSVSSVPSKQSAAVSDWNRIAKITDFGLAKQLDEDGGQTVTGQVMGTPSYMAPEQAAGRVHEIGPLADVYALGAILYKCLTGRAPFQGASTRETLHQVLHVEPVAPNRLVTTVPVELNTITLKCLEKDPARRYGSAEELADDLRRYLNGEPIKARPLSAVGRSVKWARRNPVVAALSSLATTLFLVGSILVTGLWLRAESEADNARKETKRANEERDIADEERGKAKLAQAKEALQRDRAESEAKEAKYQKGVAERSAEAAKKAQARAEEEETRARLQEAKAKQSQKQEAIARQQAERSERDTRRALAANLITRAFEAWKRTNHKSACDLLDQVPPDLRQWEWHFLRRVMYEGHTQVNGLGGWLAFHPNGTHVAGFVRPGQFGLVDLREVDKPVLLEGAVNVDLRPQFSPDGKILLAGGPKGVLRWEFPSGKLLPTPEEGGRPVQAVAYAPDGKSYAAAGPGGVRLWSSEGKVLHSFDAKAPVCFSLDFDRQSELLLWLGGPGTPQGTGQLRIWETDSGQARGWPQERKEGYHAVALSPERDELFLLGEEKIEIVAPRTGKPAGPDVQDKPVGDRYVRSTPDGQYWVLRGPSGLSFIETATGKAAFRLPVAKQLSGFSFTADSQHVVVSPLLGEKHANFWSIKPRFEARWLQMSQHQPSSLSFSPDSRFLLTAGTGPACVWELASGRLVRTLFPARVGAWSPDGRWIATGNYNEDGDPEYNLRLYEAATGKLVWRKKELPGTAVAFTSDSKQLLVGSRVSWTQRKGKLSLLEVGDGKVVWSADSGLIREITFSPQGDAIWGLESVAPHVARFDPKTGKSLPRLMLHEGLTFGWAFASKGKRWLSFGLADVRQVSPEIALRDQDTRSEFLLQGFRGQIYSADWHPSQSRVVNTDEKGNLQIWDYYTSQELCSIDAGFALVEEKQRKVSRVTVRFRGRSGVRWPTRPGVGPDEFGTGPSHLLDRSRPWGAMASTSQARSSHRVPFRIGKLDLGNNHTCPVDNVCLSPRPQTPGRGSCLRTVGDRSPLRQADPAIQRETAVGRANLCGGLLVGWQASGVSEWGAVNNSQIATDCNDLGGGDGQVTLQHTD
jgi:serine/threonine protein kinase/WD40 repeat protein